MKPDYVIHEGDCRIVLQELPAASIHAVICSPPYWGLRKYEGVEPNVWGDPNGWHVMCHGIGHDWDAKGTGRCMRGFADPLPNARCGAWFGLLGLEPTIEMYVEHIVECFRAVKRVLRDDGSCWVNCGDSYAASGTTGGGSPVDVRKPEYDRNGGDPVRGRVPEQRSTASSGLAPKNLIGQPWRVAFALQADGWYLRSAMPWVKRSAMPESATDRPTSALECMFLFAKSPRYYWDMEAVRVKAATATIQRDKYSRILADDGPQSVRHDHETQVDPGGRAFRNTDLFFESLKPPYGMIFVGDEPVGLDVTPEGLKEKHYASFPRKLIRPLILATTSEKGCCPECGAPWRRVTEQTLIPTAKAAKTFVVDERDALADGNDQGANRQKDGHRPGWINDVKTLGWKPGCTCRWYRPKPDCPESVLDVVRSSATIGTWPTGYANNAGKASSETEQATGQRASVSACAIKRGAKPTE